MSKFDGRCSDPHKDYMNNRAAPAPQAEGTSGKCGEPAESFIPRWGMSFACALPKGHEGEHKRGGTCFKHGEYIGQQCPKWPDCIPGAAPAETARPYHPKLIERLKDQKESAHYLMAAAGDTREMFLKALGNVNEAFGETAGEMTAEQFYSEYCESPFDYADIGEHFQRVMAFCYKFATAFAKQRVEQALRKHGCECDKCVNAGFWSDQP